METVLDRDFIIMIQVLVDDHWHTFLVKELPLEW